ncbi:MAG TPA: hypothetical protein VHP11_00365 [Tepidisphaeraceae bacterium]|nr:hypothetical protein [Tepidisphaeraceae bacterium]
MNRRLLAILSALSLLLFLVFLGVKIRDLVRWPWRYGLLTLEQGEMFTSTHRVYRISLNRGTLSFGYYREKGPPVLLPRLPQPINGIEYNLSAYWAQQRSYGFLGFVASRSTSSCRDEKNRLGLAGTWFSLGVPYWLIMMLTLILPLVWGQQEWKQRRTRRIARGLCPICGYDLRAHRPGQRCPECGTPIPSTLATPGNQA